LHQAAADPSRRHRREDASVDCRNGELVFVYAAACFLSRSLPELVRTPHRFFAFTESVTPIALLADRSTSRNAPGCRRSRGERNAVLVGDDGFFDSSGEARCVVARAYTLILLVVLVVWTLVLQIRRRPPHCGAVRGTSRSTIRVAVKGRLLRTLAAKCARGAREARNPLLKRVSG
jgi:hypothetical protein